MAKTAVKEDAHYGAGLAGEYTECSEESHILSVSSDLP